MVKVECLLTYWLKDKDGKTIERFDDWEDPAIYEVSDKVAEELLASGNFKRVE